jgi:UDP-N-acetylglucosamine 2-epimerase (non-hydrolysing)
MAEQSHIMLVLGTRPETIKLAPVIRELGRRNHPYTVVHTGQHYSESLDSVFFDRLDLPAPGYNLGVGSQSHARQTGEMMRRLDPIVETENPDFLLVQGDTNSALAGALVAAKQETQLGHLEAGLRSCDREMPEEINRILIDHAADYLFPPTETAKTVLAAENRTQHCFVTGNTIVDAIRQHEAMAAEKSTALEDFGLSPEGYALLTAHRAENVDDPNTFGNILQGVAGFATRTGLDCLYPIHPRARNQLEQVTVPETIRLVEPLDFLDFLHVERNAAIVFTDSGGVQEETCILQVPCVTVRDSTERPESVEVGANTVAGTQSTAITAAGLQMLDGPTEWSCPFGDGAAAKHILDILERGEMEMKRHV